MYNTISFQDWPQEIPWTAQEKGKVQGEEQNQKMSVFYSVSISKTAEGQAPLISTIVGLLNNLSRGVLLKGRLYAAIRPITRGWNLWSNWSNMGIVLIYVGIYIIIKGGVIECPSISNIEDTAVIPIHLG